MQVNEAKVFELIGRLHVENRMQLDEIAALQAEVAKLKEPKPKNG